MVGRELLLAPVEILGLAVTCATINEVWSGWGAITFSAERVRGLSYSVWFSCRRMPVSVSHDKVTILPCIDVSISPPNLSRIDVPILVHILSHIRGPVSVFGETLLRFWLILMSHQLQRLLR